MQRQVWVSRGLEREGGLTAYVILLMAVDIFIPHVVNIIWHLAKIKT